MGISHRSVVQVSIILLLGVWWAQYALGDAGIDAQLIERWRLFNTEVETAYQNLPMERKEFVDVYRGIDRIRVSDLVLDQRNREFSFGPYVYTSQDPQVAIRYAGMSETFGDDLNCHAVLLKLRVPKGFFSFMDSVQALIETKSPFADTRLFIVEVGFHSKALRSKLDPFALSTPNGRLAGIQWYSFTDVLSKDRMHLVHPDHGCR